jgi:hypothetical protein
MDSALNFHKIVEVVRQSTVKEIKTLEQVMKQVAQEHEGEQPQSNEKLAKTLFLDALASAATQNSLKVLAEMITKQEISATKAVQLLKVCLRFFGPTSYLLQKRNQKLNSRNIFLVH